MPIYEFQCVSCLARSTLFFRSFAANVDGGSCDKCGSTDLARVFSRVAVLRGDDGIPFDESSLGDVDESDPRSMARWVRKMSKEMGEPLDAEMESDLERMEAGEMPTEDGAGEDFADLD